MPTQTRRVTANLPSSLLEDAMAVTGQGITETLVLGLESVVRQEALERARKLKGKLDLQPDEGRNHVPAGNR